MDDMEQKLNAILRNPQMMAQIMNMAQSFGKQQEEPVPQPPSCEPPPTTIPQGMDLSVLQKVAGIAQQAGIDRNQQALVKALRPYLSNERISKLEKAMRAAKIAGLASSFLGNSGLLLK